MIFTAQIKAICPIDGTLKTYRTTVDVPRGDIDAANEYCQTNYLGFMLIDGIFVEEIGETEAALRIYRINLN